MAISGDEVRWGVTVAVLMMLVADTVDDAAHRLAATRSMIGWYVTGAVTAATGLLPPRSWRAGFLPESVVDGAHPASADPGVWLRAERVNLRAAVTVAFELGELESVLRLCVSQWWLFLAEKYADDLVATHALGLRAADHLRADREKALLLVQQGFAYRSLGRFRDAVDSCTAAIRLAEAVGGVELVATALEGAGLAAGRYLCPSRRTWRKSCCGKDASSAPKVARGCGKHSPW